jgi:general secretion pathway protein K
VGTDREIRRELIRSRGFALLVVLWVLALAALIGMQVAALGRRETQIAANLRAADILEAAADGAVNEAIFRLMRKEISWAADGIPHAVNIGRIRVVVAVTNEGKKTNINTATVDALATLMVTLGVDPNEARTLASAIVAWRGGDQSPGAVNAWGQRYRAAGLDYMPPFAPFESLDEVGLVLGVTPQIYSLLAPQITVYGNAQAVAIDAHATGSGGASFARHAVVLPAGREGYSILVWDRGPG